LYNRYIPDANGAFQRTVVEDRAPEMPNRETPAPGPAVSPLSGLLPAPAEPGDLLLLIIFFLLFAACGEEERPGLLAAAFVCFFT